MLMLHSSMKYDQLMNILRFEIAGDVEGTTYILYFLRAGLLLLF